MRYVLYIALFIVLTPGLAHPQTSTEQVDIEAVEKELRIEREVTDIILRAKKRAEIAVDKSSIGRELSRLIASYKKEQKKFKQEELALVRAKTLPSANGKN